MGLFGPDVRTVRVTYNWEGKYWRAIYSISDNYKFDTKKKAVKKARELAKIAAEKDKRYDYIDLVIEKKSGEVQERTKYG